MTPPDMTRSSAPLPGGNLTRSLPRILDGIAHAAGAVVRGAWSRRNAPRFRLWIALAALWASVFALAPGAAEAQTYASGRIDATATTTSYLTVTFDHPSGVLTTANDATFNLTFNHPDGNSASLELDSATLTDIKTITVTRSGSTMSLNRLKNVLEPMVGTGLGGGANRSVFGSVVVTGASNGLISQNISITPFSGATGELGVTVSEEQVTVTEASGSGREATYTVVLDSPPGDNVTITPQSGDTNAATVAPATLTFTRNNWNTPQTVTVTGVDDSEDNPNDRREVEITHGISDAGSKGGYDEVTVDSVDVTVTDDDDDPPTVTLNKTGVTVSEGAGTEIYTVKLEGTQPTATVTISISKGGSDQDAFNVDPSELTFTTSNWNTEQEVTVTGVDDVRNNPGNERSGLVQHSASGGNYAGVMISNVAVTVSDDDTGDASVVLSRTAVTVDEDAGEATYTVKLDGARPLGDVTITVTRSETDAAEVSPDTLTFTPSNWDTAQTVTVTGVNDRFDNPGNQRTASIEHSASGGGYDSVSIPDVAITVTDDDDPPTVTLNKTGVTMSEGAGTDTYTVKLEGAQPTATVTISISKGGSDQDAFNVDPTELTFTTSNWNTEQTVTVTGVDDVRNNPGNERSGLVQHSASGGNYAGVTIGNVAVTVSDDDTGDASVVLSGTAVTVDEDAGEATYTVKLDGARPLGDVTVTVTRSETEAAVVAPDSLTFTPGNWDTPQTVTVTGVNDRFDNPGNQRTASIEHSASGGGYDSVSIPDVAITVTDDDENPPGPVTGLTATPEVGNLRLMWTAATNADGYVAEIRRGSGNRFEFNVSGGSTTSYTFPAMANLEKATVYTVRVWATRMGVWGMSSGEVTERTKTDPPAKVSTPNVGEEVGQLNVAWTPVVGANGYKVQWKSGNEDYDPDTRQHVASGNNNTNHIIPNLTPGIEHTIRVLATRQYADDGEASDEVKATPMAPAPGQVSGVTPTPGPEEMALSWNQVTEANGYKVQWKSGTESYDPDTRQAAIGDGATTTHTITGLTGGTEYTIQVIATRASAADGPASPEVKATAQHRPPGKAETPIVEAQIGQLALTWDPAVDATGYRVQWKSGDQAYDADAREAVVSGGAATTYILRNLTGGTEYTIRMIATRNNAPDGEASGEATGTPYGGPSVSIRPTALTVNENGGTATYRVKLNAPPGSSGATIALSAVDGRILRYPTDKRTLSFTRGNWDVSQTVTVTGVDNDIEDPGGSRTVTITHTARNYGDNLAIPSVTVTVVDDDAAPPPPPPGARLVLTPSSIAEDGGTATVTATLDRAAAAEVTLTVSAAPAGGFTLSANRVLTIAAGSTTSTGEVTITAVDNEELDPDRRVTVSAEVTGNGVRAPGPETLTILDDDQPPPAAALVLTPSSIAEDGGAAAVTATLDGAARAEVTLTVSAAAVAPAVADHFTLSANRVLTIAAGSTASTGEVTITAVDDNVFEPDKTVTVSAAAAGGGVQDPASVTLTIAEDDSAMEERETEMVLAGMARGLASGVVNVLGGRFDASPTGGARMTLAGHRLQAVEGGADGAPPAWYGTAGADPHRWAGAGLNDQPGPGTALSGKDLLLRSSFELPLNASGASGAAGAPSWTLWGRGAVSGFEGSADPSLDVDGTFYSGYLGMDYRPWPHVLLGLAVSRSKGTVDSERTGADPAKTEIDMELNSVLPYVHWEPRPGLGVWTLVGAGTGEMKVRTDDGATVTTDLASYLGAAGVRRELTTWRGVDLALKADAFTATVYSKGNAEEGIPKVRGNAVRVRAAVEGSLDWKMGSDSRLTPSLELGGRWDDGNPERGLGAELGGGLAYTHPGLGLSVEADARYLLLHKVSSLDEWGASLKVKLDPGAAGRGASLTVAPVWGQAPDGADGLWEGTGVLDQLGSGSEDAGWTPQQLDVALAWALPLSRDRGMVTPYSGVTLGGSDSTRYRLGSRLTFGPSLNLTLEGERTEQAHEPVSHGLSARLGVRW